MLNTMDKVNRVLFTVFILGVIAIVLLPKKAFAAECTPDGAYGETCVYDKRFEVSKKVRLEGDDTWKDKVIDVKDGEIIEFRIKIKNVGELEVDDMKMTDYLPEELFRTGGDGLTEYWSDFEADSSETFIIQARIRREEFDRDDNFEKCIVNKAKAEYDGDKVGSDTATVCYGDRIEELPETGATMTEALTIMSLVSTGLGLSLKKRLK